jgi:antitoxin HigA-1
MEKQRTEVNNMDTDLIELSTPGEVLKEEFLDPMGITPYALAKAIFVDPPRIDAIIKGRRRITADTAIRLSRFFGTTPSFWTNMQSRYDIELLMEQKETEFGAITHHHVAS